MAGSANEPISSGDESSEGETKEKVIQKDEDGDEEDGDDTGVEEGSDGTDDDDKETKKEGKSKKKDKESASDVTSGDVLSEEEATSKDGAKVAEGGGSSLTFPVLIIALLCVVFGIVVALKPTATHNYKSVDDFLDNIEKMKSDFPAQYDVYWNMLSNGGRKHLNKIYNENTYDVTPLAYLVAGYAGAGPTLKCFVSRLAAAFAYGYEFIDSNDFAGSDESNKAKLYNLVQSKLGESNKLLVVLNIDKLDFKVAQLFMSFADSHNSVATYPQSLILFTTELPLAIEYSDGRVSDEGEAGNHFKNVLWEGAHEDQTAPLWSRIGDGLMLIQGEEGLLKC